MNRIQSIAAVTCFLGATAFGDIQYEMTSRVTGGSVANMPIVGSRIREPHTATHYIKGNRMALVSKSMTTVYDLDAGNVTSINTDKKTYSVMTFEQMKAQLEESMKKMQEAMNDKKRDVDYTWSVKVDDAGEEKEVAGFNAHHFILTMTGEAVDQQSGNTVGMRMVLDNWMAKNVPGMKEVHDFNRRMAAKLGIDFGSSMNPMVRAQLGNGWEQAAKEMMKMEGFTVYTSLRTTSMLNGQEVMVPQSQQQQGPSAGQVAKESAASSVMGRIPGGFGGFGGGGRKKKSDDAPAAQPGNGPMVPATQIEMTTELTRMSNGGFDPSVFEVPAGFKQVEEKRMR